MTSLHGNCVDQRFCWPVSISPRSTRRENSVAPPEARMRACSTQFSRSMRPLKSSDWLTRSMSPAFQLAICS
jgi:hypothetical protein